MASALPSKLFKVNADVGAITAANSSPVAWLQENHDAVAQLTIKDRRRNKGLNQQWGDGDTPVQDVLRLVKVEGLYVPGLRGVRIPGSWNACGRTAALHGLHARAAYFVVCAINSSAHSAPFGSSSCLKYTYASRPPPAVPRT